MDAARLRHRRLAVAHDPQDPLYYEREKMVGARHPHRGRWLLLLAVIAIAIAGVWLVPQNRNDRENRDGSGVASGSTGRETAAGEPANKAVGTSGHARGSAESDGAQVVTEIETITGANDAMSLVGRRVDLHVDVLSRANDHAFWVGSPDNRLLVVFGRDNRTGSKRQTGVPATHGVSPVRNGQTAAISGTIQPVPKAEDRLNWALTEADNNELKDRKVYIRADTVSSDGHGTF
jgi:hypothetical protein